MMTVTPARRVRTPARRVGNLPADLTSFVGRSRELAEIRQLLSVSRLVTLTGVGGVGKTRLAVRAADEQQRAYDAVWLVDLTSLTDPSLVVSAVAATMGLRDQSAVSPLETLAAFLAPQRALLVLDNCEHLLEACVALAGHLLRAAPRLRILATSRQSLGIIGEQQLKVAPLPVPEPHQTPTPEALKLYDAVALLVDRAAAVVPEFAITDGNQTDVVKLCGQLDGIPLAIELAARRLRALSVSQLVERLGQRYRLLTDGDRAAASRQQTLHALIDWSFRLLTPAEQTLWTRMSIFPDHVGLDAAEAVCAGDGIEREDILDLIDTLQDKSLLVREEHDGQVRYRMLETLREFGRLRLGESEWRTLRRRHRDFFCRLVDQAAAEWFGPRQVAWFTRLRLEHAHLRTALDFCLNEPGETETGLRMAVRLHRPHWLPNTFHNEARHWYDRMLKANPEPTTTRAQALSIGAWLAVEQRDVAAGRPLMEEARALADKLGDRALTALSSYVSGLSALYSTDFPRAVTLLEEAVALYTAGDDRFGIAVALIALASAKHSHGDTARAAKLFEQSIALAESHGEGYCRAWGLACICIHLWRLGDNERAASAARKSLVAGRAFDNWLNVATNMETLAWILTSQGRHEGAARMLGAVEAVGRSASVSPLLIQEFVGFHERCVAILKDSLGEQTFTRALQQGRALTVEQAVAEVLGDPPGRSREPPAAGPAGAEPSPLTPREREIAELVAQGLSNKQIATTLVIAPRTAECHIDHIMTKLGFNSRTQIATWATARRTSEPDT